MAGASSKPEARSTYIYHREIIERSTHNYGQLTPGGRGGEGV